MSRQFTGHILQIDNNWNDNATSAERSARDGSQHLTGMDQGVPEPFTGSPQAAKVWRKA